MFGLSNVAILFLSIAAPASLVGASPVASAAAAASTSSWWLAGIQRQGTVPFGTSTSYKVFRNVMDYGAKGMSLSYSHLVKVVR
jgi:hypothetical protein